VNLWRRLGGVRAFQAVVIGVLVANAALLVLFVWSWLSPQPAPSEPPVTSEARPAASPLLIAVQAPTETLTLATSVPSPISAPPSPATQAALRAVPPAATRPPLAPVRPPTSPAPLAAPPSAPGQTDPRVEQALRELRDDADRVGQLLLLGWIGHGTDGALPALRELRAGGLVLVDNASSAAEATALTRSLADLARGAGLQAPLLAVDHEGGPVQRIVDETVPNLGSNAQFAARQPTDAEACQRGLDQARALRGLGFNVNLAPVLDVNNNPANPIIGERSYGADPQLVGRLGSAYIRGLQGGGVAAVGKHFPGHGNTAVDSHLQLPVLNQTLADLERVELVPFRQALRAPNPLAAIMVGHLALPALDPSGTPASLSRPIVTGLLRERLGFQGLVVSDDLGAMHAVTDNFPPGEAAVHAVQAGVDLLILVGGAPQRASRDALLAALASGQLRRDRLDEAVRHVLTVKSRFGLLDGSVPPAFSCG
jgi:beta-N-acetylhexosaminidase